MASRYTLTQSIENDDGLTDKQEQAAIDKLVETLNATKQSLNAYYGSIVRTPKRIEIEIKY